MSIMASPYGPDLDDVEEPELVPLTQDQAQGLRARMAVFSPWRVLVVQGLAAVLLVLFVWLAFGRSDWVGSVAYGCFAVWVPAALFVRGFARQKNVPGAGAALAGIFVWELVKIILTVALLLVAPRVVVDLNWLALLSGFVVTMKASWFAMLWQHRRNVSIAES
jgi:ATP synthase protein I